MGTSRTAKMPTRRDGVARKKKLINAALRVVEKNGIRGLNHRAIAKFAKVPLGSATYYFPTVQVLISETFNAYNEAVAKYADELIQQGTALLNPAKGKRPAQATLAKNMAKLLSDYVAMQATKLRRFQVIKTAFMHGAITNKKMNTLVSQRQENFAEAIYNWLAQAKSKSPKADAEVLTAFIAHKEQEFTLNPKGLNGRALTLSFGRLLGSMF